MSDIKVQYQHLIDNLKVGVFRSAHGSPGRFLFANQAFAKMLGYSPKAMSAMNLAGIVADKNAYQAFLKKVQKTGFIEDEELMLKRKDGQLIWGSFSIVSVKETAKKREYFDAIVEDITEQKRAEKDLIESRELFKIIFDNSPVAVIVCGKDERIIAWNPFTEKLLAMSKMQLFNKPYKEIYPAKEWQKLKSFNFTKKSFLTDVSTRVVKADGSLLDVSMAASALKDTEGKPIGTIAILYDLSRQKAIENKLRDSETKLRVILNNSPAAITLTDAQERIILWNPFAETLFGFNKQELYLKQVQDLYPAEEWKKIRAENIRVKGSKHHFETRILRKDGKTVDVDLSVNILKDAAQNIIGSVGVVQDITEQKRIRQMLLQAKMSAEEANNAKSLFLAKMSHEVRTPMNAIIGMLDLTLDTELTEEQKDNLKVARDATENLLKLLNDILDLSKAEAGKIVIEDIEINVHDIIKNVCKGLSVLSRNKQIDLVWSVEKDVPKFLVGDPVRLRQVIINLVNNAIKFTHKGKVEVKVNVMTQTPKECELVFSVSDTGIGIPKEKHQTIFEVFNQGGQETTRRYGGTGLGLAICKKLVELMGGHIWVESEEHKGSAFKFALPFGIGTTQQKMASTEADALSAHGAPLQILLAEDNPINQKIIVKLLEKKGWTYQTAVNGREVLELLNKQRFDLVLMDDEMPEMDGVEATKLIRNEEKQTAQHIPIIAMTAHAMTGDRERYLSYGMDGYVAKPIDREAFYGEVAAIVKKAQEK